MPAPELLEFAGRESRPLQDDLPPPRLSPCPNQPVIGFEAKVIDSLRRTAWRSAKIASRANMAVADWRRRQSAPENDIPIEPNGVFLRHLRLPSGPVLPKFDGAISSLPLPRRELVFKAGFLRSIGRLLLWFVGGGLFLAIISLDWFRGRSNIESRAQRLRQTFEKMGTTFIKVGQQLSMRLDLLPYAYTRELEKMLDNVPPFQFSHAIKAIERATGDSLEEVFSAFDPEPIGSASIACVFHAILKSGERVAVKVRRPKIGIRLAADLRALGWIANAAELLLFAPGFTANFVYELSTMLMEELDFVSEARFADLYRLQMRKTDEMDFVTVPKVFFQYSNDEVMVSEFVTGIWMKDLLPSIESKNPEVSEQLRSLNIDPVILARRIQLIARFNNFENLFFHADLHPGNILIKPDNRIVLIDFGSCGSFSKKELNCWKRWFDAQSIDDVGGMVQAAMGILEPLPPIDKDAFALRMEFMFWNDLYAIKSKHSNWSERISSRLWMGFINLSREFQIPLRLNLLRMIRASMLTDTIAIRLDNDQDPYREFRRYEREAGWRAKRRLMKRVHRLLGPSKYIRLEQGLESTLKLVYEVQRTVDSIASIRIGAIVGWVEYFITLLLRTFTWAIVSATALTALAWYAQRFRLQAVLGLFNLNAGMQTPLSLYELGGVVVTSPMWQWAVGVPLLMVFYRISFRLKERHPSRDR